MMKTQCRMPSDEARLNIISNLILEMVNHSKPMLATIVFNRDEQSNYSFPEEPGSILNWIQKDKILIAVYF